MRHTARVAHARGRLVLPLLAAAAVAFALALWLGLGRSSGPRTAAAAGVAPCGEQRLFGHLRSLARRGGRYELRFDPALFTSGATANAAAAADGAVPPGQPVPNDNYVVDETHRTYLYLVSPSARITVLSPAIRPRRISVAQLAALVRGERPVKLFESLESGFWIRVHVDTVCAADQQYHP